MVSRPWESRTLPLYFQALQSTTAGLAFYRKAIEFNGFGVTMSLMNEEFYNLVLDICSKDKRYHPESYEFVMEALSYSQKKFKKTKHVSGPELLKGIKELMLKKFGPMVLPVLNYWGIKSTDDFGNIVFNLVEYKILSKDEQDQYDSFKNAYDFEEVFDKGYRKQLARRLKTMRF